MPAGALIGGSALLGAGASIYGANKAAGATDKAAKAANAEQARQFDLVRGDTAKLRGLGDSASDRINKLYGYGGTPAQAATPDRTVNLPYGLGGAMGGQVTIPGTPAIAATGGSPDMSVFFESPDYTFRQSQGEQAINRAAAASGRYNSGAVLKGLDRYNSNLASGEFASFYERLAQQAGLGVTGIGQSAAAGANAANNIGANIVNAGNSRASAYMGAAQGVNSAVQGGISNWYLNRYLNPGVPA